MAELAGQDMDFILAVLDCDTDWPARTSWTGMRQWNHTYFPCPDCDIPKTLMDSPDSIKGVSLNKGPWTEYTHEQYNQNLKLHLVAAWIV